MPPGQDLDGQPGPSGGSIDASSLAELKDALGLQRAILASLEETPPSDETSSLIVEAKLDISRLQKAIAQAREKQPNGKMNTWHATPFHGSSNPDSGTSTPASSSTPNTTGSDWALAGFGSQSQRKRNYSATAEDKGRPEKSRKTTPASADTPFTAPTSVDSDAFWDDNESVIDLTGDDEQYLEQQRLREEAFKQNKRKIDADAELARRLQSGGSSPEGQPPSLPPSQERNAFDRILGRPPQATNMVSAWRPSQQQPEVIDLEDEDDREYYSRRAIEAASRSTQPSSSHPYPRLPAGMDNDGPGSVYPGQYVPSTYFGSSTNLSRAAPPQVPGRPPGYAHPGQPLRFHPGMSAAELAHQAHQARHGAATPGFFPGSQQVYPAPGSQIPAHHRPGYIHGGSYNALAAYDYASGGLPGPSRDDPLATIIRRTTRAMELDDEGNPLDDRLLEYMDDVVNDPRKNAEEIQELLSNIRPDMEIPIEERGKTPEGLRYPLYPHQQLALQWMMSNEDGTNKGGILADDMGLGKTISALALLLNRPPPDNKVKTNLIVGPVSLIKQWESEIAKKLKTSHKLSVLLYHGNAKPLSWSDMRRFDVILTTYGRLGQQAKRYNEWVENHRGEDPSSVEELKRACPLVHHDTQFYRVVLDEAQCIKNEKTLAAVGACKLRAVHRWCLTGTPMMNGVHELYSLIRFLRIRPYNHRDTFRRDFGTLLPNQKGANSRGSRNVAMSKLRTVLKAIMLRRTKTSEIDGKPILNLPAKTQETVYATFSPEEEVYYRDMETSTRTKFNKYLREGTVGKNYSSILTLLLRLRQVCCHPHLNLDVDYVGNAQVAPTDMVSLAKTLTPAVVARLKEAEAFECPICYDAVADPVLVLPCGHDTCPECFTTLTEQASIRNLQAGNEAGGAGGAKCPQCRGDINATNIINYSTFKQVHMPEGAGEGPAAEEARDEEDDDETESDASTESDDDDDDDDDDDVDERGNLKDFIVNDDEDGEYVDAEAKGKKKKKKKSKGRRGKGKEKAKEVKPHMLKELRLQARKNRQAHKRYMRYLHKNWETSAKVDKCCELLAKIQESGEKTIIFSQFTLLLDLLEVPIKHQLGIAYRRYDGAMSRNLRDEAAREFQDPGSPTKVLLVSLKAGNAGLNLTAASQVIIMDPFWNPYIEMQAVDRAHRIGQQRPVQVHRILVRETIEDRIVHLQEEKRQLVDAALDEGESKQLGRLSARELGYLFGVHVRGQ